MNVAVASFEMSANALRVQEENGVKAMQREDERQVKEVEDLLSRAQHAFATQSLELQHTSSKTDLLKRDLQSLHALRGREKLLCDTELQDMIYFFSSLCKRCDSAKNSRATMVCANWETPSLTARPVSTS